MKRLAVATALAALTISGCSSGSTTTSTNARPATAPSTAATQDKPSSEATEGGDGGQSFVYQDQSGYRWRIAIQIGESGPTVHADNCTQGGFDASPGHTNVAVKLTMTNLLKDRGEPVPTALVLDAGNTDNTMIGPADSSGFSCLATPDIGRWFEPGETVAVSGIIRNVPDPIPAGAVATFHDLDGNRYGPLVKLKP
ncbi:hypothetical protein AB5J52_06810 [Streptomyces sp. R39]|uniref:DUF4352 domain-containing protein n=1 Tax=Streptomyces sp. R39 TaxID=3238631 RepID=A0AB39QL03_9ACTN